MDYFKLPAEPMVIKFLPPRNKLPFKFYKEIKCPICEVEKTMLEEAKKKFPVGSVVNLKDNSYLNEFYKGVDFTVKDHFLYNIVGQVRIELEAVIDGKPVKLITSLGAITVNGVGCICDIAVLMNTGCKCGQIEREKDVLGE